MEVSFIILALMTCRCGHLLLVELGFFVFGEHLGSHGGELYFLGFDVLSLWTSFVG